MPDNNQYFFQLRFVFRRYCHGNPKKLGTRNWCFSRLDDFYFFIDDNMSVTGNKTPKGLPVESKDLFVPPLSDLSQGILFDLLSGDFVSCAYRRTNVSSLVQPRKPF